MVKLWSAVSHQGTVFTELRRERCLPVPFGSQGATSADWQQDVGLSLAEEMGEQELAFPSEDMESNSTSPVVKLSLSEEFIPLIKRTSAVLQVPWPTEGETRQSIFYDESTTSPVSPPPVHPDFLYKF
ncbi:UNVERIFIED_CONTAM: hypothetical protein FKN15_066726 [Acipenser sinensis]